MKAIVSIILSIVTFTASAQDIHFTMWDAMPITVNPATAGVFNGDIRGVLNYRNQWASIGSPYKTYSVMLDGGLFKNKWRHGYLGTGLSVFKDVAGSTKFGTTKISLALSGVLYLDDKNTGTIGLLSTWGQNSMDASNLEWDAQFNGQSFDPRASSNETMGFEGNSFVDFSVGALWAYGNGAKKKGNQDQLALKSGLAFYHLTRPKTAVEFGEVEKMYSKWAFHADGHIGITNSTMALKPKLLVFMQGPTREVALGMLFRFMLSQESRYTKIFKEMAIAFGGYYRFGDAFAPSVEFESAGFAIGLAYDMNMSGLTAATGGSGGPEIFIRFQNPNPFSYGRGSRSSARFR